MRTDSKRKKNCIASRVDASARLIRVFDDVRTQLTYRPSESEASFWHSFILFYYVCSHFFLPYCKREVKNYFSGPFSYHEAAVYGYYFAMTMKSSCIEPLAEQFEHLAASPKSAPGASNLPSPLLIYQSGCILFHARRRVLANPQDHLLIETYRRIGGDFDLILKSLPKDYVAYLWSFITDSFLSILSTHRKQSEDSSDDADNINGAILSLCGCLMHSFDACQHAFCTCLCEYLVSLYHYRQSLLLQTHSTLSLKQEENQTMILCLLSYLIVHGLILPLKYSASSLDPDERLQSLMETILQCFVPSDSQSFCLGDLFRYQQEERRRSLLSIQRIVVDPFFTIVDAIIEAFPQESAQRDYLIQVIESAPISTVSISSLPSESLIDVPFSPRSSAIMEYSSSLERNIDQVHTILAHLGLGYIEVALSCYNNDPERTIATLLESEMDPSILHPRIRDLDTALPAKKDDTLVDLANVESRNIQKARVQAMDAKYEKEAHQLDMVMRQDEYDDDYNDQYDDIDVGGDDNGMYDLDLDAIRTYNRIAREIESEDSFWNEMKNTNQKSSSTNTNNTEHESEEKKYVGPDKGKGGRVIGPDGRFVKSSQTSRHKKTKGRFLH